MRTPTTAWEALVKAEAAFEERAMFLGDEPKALRLKLGQEFWQEYAAIAAKLPPPATSEPFDGDPWYENHKVMTGRMIDAEEYARKVSAALAAARALLAERDGCIARPSDEWFAEMKEILHKGTPSKPSEDDKQIADLLAEIVDLRALCRRSASKVKKDYGVTPYNQSMVEALKKAGEG